MKNRSSSNPPQSGVMAHRDRAAGLVDEHAVAHVVQHLKTYDEHPSLDRVWSTVARAVPGHESMMRHGRARGTAQPRRTGTWVRATVGVTLVAAGALLGVFLDRSFGRGPVYLAQSEAVQGTVGQFPAAQPEAPVVTEHKGEVRGPGAERLVAAAERSQASATGGALRFQSAASRLQSAALRRQSTAVHGQSAAVHGQSAAGLAPSSPVGVASSSADPSVAGALSSESGAVESAAVLPTVAWHGLAERGDFAGAAAAIDSAGGFEQAFLLAGPDELMTLADVARAVGRPALAIQALRVVLDQYRDNENAPLAAMTLGNLLRRAGDAVGAAEAFALNRRLSPGGDFAEDALVREFDMAMEAMDLTEAERLRAQYEREYPEGRHSEVLRAEVDRLATELLPPEGQDEEDAAPSPTDSADAPDEQPSSDDESPTPSDDASPKSTER